MALMTYTSTPGRNTSVNADRPKKRKKGRAPKRVRKYQEKGLMNK